MSTSSGSGDEYENLKEAIDPDLLSNDLFRPKDESVRLLESVRPVRLPASLRNTIDASSNFNPLEIKVTPEFKSYVSKRLRKKLDELIDDTQELPGNNRKKSKKKNEGGSIRLLKSSKNFIDMNEEGSPVLHVKKHKKGKKRKMNESSNSSDSYEEKAKEVAVTAEWILSGKATEGWAPCTKGELEVISVPPVSKS